MYVCRSQKSEVGSQKSEVRSRKSLKSLKLVSRKTSEGLTRTSEGPQKLDSASGSVKYAVCTHCTPLGRSCNIQTKSGHDSTLSPSPQEYSVSSSWRKTNVSATTLPIPSAQEPHNPPRPRLLPYDVLFRWNIDMCICTCKSSEDRVP